MQAVLKLNATVLPGHRIEVAAPNLPEGARVELIVMLPEELTDRPRDYISVLDFLDSLPAFNLTSEDWERIDSDIQKEKERLGTLNLPASGNVYADAQTIIYTAQRHPVDAPVCRPFWQAAMNRQIRVVSSDLTLMETLILPVGNGDPALQAQFSRFPLTSDVNLLPITQDILCEAARLRATVPALKTPDAIHAATALLHGCALFVTNDAGFRRVRSLSLALLDDILDAP